MSSSGANIKSLLKNLLNSFCLILVLPLYLVHLLFGLAGNRDRSFWGCSQLLSLIPGLPGNYLRKNFYRMAMTYCAQDCAILFGTLFSQADTEIGKGVYIGPQCNIGKCRIENHCTLGSGVHIMSGSRQHNFEDVDSPIRNQGGFYEKVSIGEDTWIGNGALIMANIGKKCIVGAGSVVTRDVEDYSVVAGNPARLIRKRA